MPEPSFEQYDTVMALQLRDGFLCHGTSFGARKSVAGELVFQTGMVGYPESLTDPSYRGQILVITFPLVGNYGVPSRAERDELLKDLPAHFESDKIHVAGLVVAAYAGEKFSHHLAESSLGTWLKEQGVPAIYGVDTRALTKRIREEGSMLGKLVEPQAPPYGNHHLSLANGDAVNGYTPAATPTGMGKSLWGIDFENIPWVDPNLKNLVAEGKQTFDKTFLSIINAFSVNYGAQNIFAGTVQSHNAPVWPTLASGMCRCRVEIQSTPVSGLARS